MPMKMQAAMVSHDVVELEVEAVTVISGKVWVAAFEPDGRDHDD